MSLKPLFILLFLLCVVGIAFVVHNLRAKSGDDNSCAEDCGSKVQEAASKKPCDTTCQSKECVLTAAQMYEFMDENVSPCEDFYRFACGNYILKNYPEADDIMSMTMLDSWHEFALDVKRIIQDFPNKHKGVGVSYSTFSKLKIFFEVCMEHQTSGRSSVKDILAVLSDYGLPGWSNISDPEWRFPDGKLDMFLGSSFAMNILDFVLIYTEDREDEFADSTDPQLTLLPGALQIGYEEWYLNPNDTKNREGLQMLKVELTSVFELLEFPSAEAEKMALDIIELDTKLTIFSKQWNERLGEDMVGEKTTKYAFEPTSSKWFEVIRHYLNALGIDETYYPKISLVMRNRLQLDELKDLIDNVPHKTLANYMVYMLIDKYRFHTDFFFNAVLSNEKKYRDFIRMLSFMFGPGRCAVLAAEIFRDVLVPAYMKYNFNETSIESFNKLFDVMVKTTSKLISNVTWITDKGLKNALAEKIQDIYIPTKNLSRSIDYKYVDEKYRELPVDDHNFLKNVLTHFLYIKSHRFKEDFDGKVQKVSGELPLDITARYIYNRGNVIIIGLALLRLPFFAVTRPIYANLGGMGQILGHEIGHVIFRTLEDYDGSREVVESWKKEKSCLVSQYSNYSYDAISSYVQGSLTIFENFPDQIGANAAFRAYKDYMQKTDEMKLIPVHGFKNEELFFISGSQMFCECNKPDGYLRYSKDTHTSLNYRILGSFSNMPELSETFNCPQNSLMNPSKKCNILHGI